MRTLIPSLVISESVSEKGIEESYNESSIEPYVSFRHVSRLVNHLADEREDAKKCNRFDHTSVAEEEDLQFWERLLVMAIRDTIFMVFMVEYFGVVDGYDGFIG
jgi:hypothetical protein